MADTTIKVHDNGPYVINGPLALMDGDGNPIPVDATVALCRCGESANRPFCDGSHSSSDFTSTVRAGD